jgi:hypothetical protein
MPDRRDQLIVADDAFSILNEMNQDIEHLRLDRYETRVAPKFPTLNVDGIGFEYVDQSLLHDDAEQGQQGNVRGITGKNQGRLKDFGRRDR